MIDEMMLTETVVIEKPIVSPKNYDWVQDEAMAIIVKSEMFDFDLCGKSMLDWLKLACVRMLTKVIEPCSDEELVSIIKKEAVGKKIVVVLYSDTPLLEQETILKALDYFSSKDINVLALARGYIIKVDYLNTVNEIFSPARKYFSPEQFLIVSSPLSISKATDVLWQRIRKYHMENGVILKGENTIFIDADVQIESGVVIEPNNVIVGQSVIEQGVWLKSGNYIENSLIKANSILQGENIVEGKSK